MFLFATVNDVIDSVCMCLYIILFDIWYNYLVVLFYNQHSNVLIYKHLQVSDIDIKQSNVIVLTILHTIQINQSQDTLSISLFNQTLIIFDINPNGVYIPFIEKPHHGYQHVILDAVIVLMSLQSANLHQIVLFAICDEFRSLFA